MSEIKNRDEIKELLPHREPMLLIDTVSLVDGFSMGSYTVRGDEYFLQGHFPGNPIVPGVILCEMMAQSSCLLINNEETAGSTPYFTGLKNVKFRNKVVPGDTINFKCELLKHRGMFYYIKATGHVGDKLCCGGELSFAVVNEAPKAN